MLSPHTVDSAVAARDRFATGSVETVSGPRIVIMCFDRLDRDLAAAHAAIQRGDHRALRTWLAATALMGGIFISGQVYEFKEFLNAGYGFTHSPAWSAFFGLTGFHGVHVTLGIIMLLSCILLSLSGRIRQDNAESVEIVGLYWHFVDVVWIIIFTVVYLIK